MQREPPPRHFCSEDRVGNAQSIMGKSEKGMRADDADDCRRHVQYGMGDLDCDVPVLQVVCCVT
jgi:hypothetical protein